MYPYRHPYKNPDFFKEAKTGPRVYVHSVEIPTAQNQNEFKLEEKSLIENNHVIGIWVMEPAGNNRAISNNQSINQAAFDAAFLTLMEEETNVVKRIPLSIILWCNQNGFPFPINMGPIQMNESVVYISNEAAVADNESITLVFEYLREK